MNDHILKTFDSEMQRLTGEILRMGDMAATQLAAAMDVLERRDSTAAITVIGNDRTIDALEHDVGHDVVRLLATNPEEAMLTPTLTCFAIDGMDGLSWALMAIFDPGSFKLQTFTLQRSGEWSTASS